MAPCLVCGRYFSSRSSSDSLPASRSAMISTAVNVLVIEPIMYCVSSVGAAERVQPGRADVGGPHERAVPDNAGADRGRVPLTLRLAHPALEVPDQPRAQRLTAGRSAH